MTIKSSTGDLVVSDVTRSFGDVTALTGVSFTVQPGGLTGFVGGNGAGKTTTMRIIMGVLAAHGGSVTWCGAPISVADQRSFGYMPEERGLYPKQKVAGQLEYLAALRGVPPGDARRQVADLLERFGLQDRAKQPLEKLSLGNQQRVQVIAAVLGSPKCLILDEPFSGLDPEAVDSMTELLREHAAQGIPVLFSSHQLDVVERLCDAVVIMRRGQVISSGTAADLRREATRSHRLTCDQDVGWVRNVDGVVALDVDGPAAVLDFSSEQTIHAVLTEALRRGNIIEFGPIVPTLSDIYREAIA